MKALTPDTTAFLVPLELIDPPTLAMRQTFDDEKLQELMESITRIGLQQPIVLEREGERFRIHAGHRRFVATQALGAATIRATINDAGTVSGEAIKIAENSDREDVNAGEEAEYLRQVLDGECGGDFDRLLALTRRSPSYLNTRLILLKGDPEVLRAVKEKRIPMGVAHELNKIDRDIFRRSYLDSAISGGATRATVARWRAQLAALGEFMPVIDTEGTPAVDASSAIPDYTPRCVVCGDHDRIYDMQFVQIHKGACEKIFRRAIEPFIEPTEG